MIDDAQKQAVIDEIAALICTKAAPEFEKRGPLAIALGKTRGLPTANPEKWLRYLSPSQMKSYSECPSKWYGEKVLGLEKGDTKATIRGRKTHACAEHVSYHGDIPAGTPDEIAGLVRALEPAIPSVEEVTAGHTLVEMEFAYVPPGWPLPAYGLMDKVRKLRKAIEDYKTTSSWEYAKTEAELLTDIQAEIYGGYALADDSAILALTRFGIDLSEIRDVFLTPEALKCFGVSPDGTKWVKFRHDYVRTKGAAQYRKTEVTLQKPEVDEGLQLLGLQAHTMVDTALLPFHQVPKNTDSCGNYGGCHMKAFCTSMGVPVPGASPELVAYYRILNEEPVVVTTLEMKAMALPKRLQQADQELEKLAATSQINNISEDGSAPAPGPGGTAPTAQAQPPASRPALPPRPPTAPVALPMGGTAKAPPHPSVNPPDGLGMTETEIPAAPAPQESALQGKLQGEADAQAAARAAAKTEKKVGLPGKGKKKTEEVLADVAKADAEGKVLPISATFPDLTDDSEIADVASDDPDYVAAVNNKIATDVALEKANEQLVEAQAGDDDDAKDDAETAVKKATRADNNAKAALEAAAISAVEKAKASVEVTRAAAQAAAAATVSSAATPVTSAAASPVAQGTVNKAAAPAPVDQNFPKHEGGAGVPTLYLIGHPMKSAFVTWEDFIAPFTAAVEQAHQVPHWRMLNYEANQALLVVIKANVDSGKFKLPRNLVFTGPLNANLHGVFTEWLIPLYGEVVK